ncbi:MAG: DoxX family protein, partial [Candidatus Tectomicrobia bacterium]
VTGIMFCGSGWGKLHDLQGLGNWFGTLGIPLPHFNALFVSTIEFVGGACLVLGLGTRVFAFLLSGVMAVALLTVGLPGEAKMMERFNITEQSLEMLQSEGVPNDVVENLNDIKNQENTGENEFLKLLEATIGKEQTVQYKSLILKHAKLHYSIIDAVLRWLFKPEVLIVVIFIRFMVTGPGRISIDAVIRRRFG